MTSTEQRRDRLFPSQPPPFHNTHRHHSLELHSSRAHGGCSKAKTRLAQFSKASSEKLQALSISSKRPTCRTPQRCWQPVLHCKRWPAPNKPNNRKGSQAPGARKHCPLRLRQARRLIHSGHSLIAAVPYQCLKTNSTGQRLARLTHTGMVGCWRRA